MVRSSFKYCLLYYVSREVTAFSVQAPFNQVPKYKSAIQAGKNTRYFWFMLREWRGDDPEGYFSDMRTWAERIIKELGVN